MLTWAWGKHSGLTGGESVNKHNLSRQQSESISNKQISHRKI